MYGGGLLWKRVAKLPSMAPQIVSGSAVGVMDMGSQTPLQSLCKLQWSDVEDGGTYSLILLHSASLAMHRQVTNDRGAVSLAWLSKACPSLESPALGKGSSVDPACLSRTCLALKSPCMEEGLQCPQPDLS